MADPKYDIDVNQIARDAVREYREQQRQEQQRQAKKEKSRSSRPRRSSGQKSRSF